MITVSSSSTQTVHVDPGPPPDTIESLQTYLRYRFRNPTLLAQALTHRSCLLPRRDGPISNERLELLGDVVLSLLVTTDLLRRYPQDNEGRLTKRRTQLINATSLATRARAHQLGRWLRVGPGEAKTGGTNRDSLLANLVEALLGAAYLDHGLHAARHIYMRLGLSPSPHPSNTHLNDAKSTLQELTVRRWKLTPTYHLDRVEGPPHAPRFTVSVSVNGQTIATGTARRRKEAEQSAARTALATTNTWAAICQK